MSFSRPIQLPLSCRSNLIGRYLEAWKRPLSTWDSYKTWKLKNMLRLIYTLFMVHGDISYTVDKSTILTQ